MSLMVCMSIKASISCGIKVSISVSTPTFWSAKNPAHDKPSATIKMGIENFISTTYTEGPKLVAQLQQHVQEYQVDVMEAVRVQTLHNLDNGLKEIVLENGGKLLSKMRN